jgi:hypothetical protein
MLNRERAPNSFYVCIKCGSFRDMLSHEGVEID